MASNSDILDIIAKKLNSFNRFISEKSSIYLKKAIVKSEEYTEKGINHIEGEKLKWDLRKKFAELGEYVFNKSNKNILDYSDDEQFILMIDKIQRLKNIINNKSKS